MLKADSWGWFLMSKNIDWILARQSIWVKNKEPLLPFLLFFLWGLNFAIFFKKITALHQICIRLDEKENSSLQIVIHGTQLFNMRPSLLGLFFLGSPWTSPWQALIVGNGVRVRRWLYWRLQFIGQRWLSVAGAASTDNCGLPPTQVLRPLSLPALRITPQNFSFPTCYFVLFDFEKKVWFSPVRDTHFCFLRLLQLSCIRHWRSNARSAEAVRLLVRCFFRWRNVGALVAFVRCWPQLLRATTPHEDTEHTRFMGHKSQTCPSLLVETSIFSLPRLLPRIGHSPPAFP